MVHFCLITQINKVNRSSFFSSTYNLAKMAYIINLWSQMKILFQIACTSVILSLTKHHQPRHEIHRPAAALTANPILHDIPDHILNYFYLYCSSSLFFFYTRPAAAASVWEYHYMQSIFVIFMFYTEPLR